MTTLAASSSRYNPKILAAREVVAHLRVVFHSCTCGLYENTIVVADALISYSGARLLVGRENGGGGCDLERVVSSEKQDVCFAVAAGGGRGSSIEHSPRRCLEVMS
jgi:hypothetical protein